MNQIRSFITMIVGLIAIIGMFATDFHINEHTDKSYKILWMEYDIEESKSFVIKEELDFIDGLNNGVTLVGKVTLKLFTGSWDFYNSLNDLVSYIKVPFLVKILLHLLLIPISLMLGMLAMVIALPVYIYKLLFFKAAISYYIGFIVSFLGIFVLSSFSETKKANIKTSNKSPINTI